MRQALLRAYRNTCYEADGIQIRVGRRSAATDRLLLTVRGANGRSDYRLQSVFPSDAACLEPPDASAITSGPAPASDLTGERIAWALVRSAFDGVWRSPTGTTFGAALSSKRDRDRPPAAATAACDQRGWLSLTQLSYRYASDSRNAPENCGLLRPLSICGAKNHCPFRGHLALTGSTLMCWRRCSRNAVRTVGRRRSRLDHRFSLGALESELPPPWHVWCLNRSAPHNALISSHIFSSGGKVGPDCCVRFVLTVPGLRNTRCRAGASPYPARTLHRLDPSQLIRGSGRLGVLGAHRLGCGGRCIRWDRQY